MVYGNRPLAHDPFGIHGEQARHQEIYNHRNNIPALVPLNQPFFNPPRWFAKVKAIYDFIMSRGFAFLVTVITMLAS
jgi:hypothetical protein